jgi:hypothetical protein
MLHIIALRLKVAYSKLTTSRITFWKLVKVGKLQNLKPSSRVIASLKANLDTYLNQSLSIGKVGIL